MKTFTDAAGRTWTISLTIGSVMQVKAKLGIDLLQPEVGDPPLLTRLGVNELLLAEIICTLLEGQFEAHQVTDKDVYNAFNGTALLAAQDAFYGEWIDFFRQFARPDRARAAEKQIAAIKAAVKAVEARLDAYDIEAAIRTALTDGAMSGPLPGRSASTLAR